jgi:hypothetical protein
MINLRIYKSFPIFNKKEGLTNLFSAKFILKLLIYYEILYLGEKFLYTPGFKIYSYGNIKCTEGAGNPSELRVHG